MLGARTVARLALQPGEGRALVGAVGVLGLEDFENRIGPGLGVAHEAGIGTFLGVLASLLRDGGDAQRQAG